MADEMKNRIWEGYDNDPHWTKILDMPKTIRFPDRKDARKRAKENPERLAREKAEDEDHEAAQEPAQEAAQDGYPGAEQEDEVLEEAQAEPANEDARTDENRTELGQEEQGADKSDAIGQERALPEAVARKVGGGGAAVPKGWDDAGEARPERVPSTTCGENAPRRCQNVLELDGIVDAKPLDDAPAAVAALVDTVLGWACGVMMVAMPWSRSR
ncbi:hypothetical protein NpPPO83_00004328 [Neofusicoccum parvum]|uniref:Uncharacterized protein n=1 Tax=Neofusicoccum parvum TaxID=310453 RepID=A0ACB5SE50_9PEZI|nr:hypothetical protein NpPPO83_00004328 [Neofusicoccum parvum]